MTDWGKKSIIVHIATNLLSKLGNFIIDVAYWELYIVREQMLSWFRLTGLIRE